MSKDGSKNKDLNIFLNKYFPPKHHQANNYLTSMKGYQIYFFSHL